MKNKIKIFMILAIGAIFLPTCQKDPNLRMPDLKTGAIPLIEKDANLDQNLDFFNLNLFHAAVSVDLYFDDKPKSMTLMITMNDDVNNKAVIQEITSYPTTAIDLTADDLVNLLPGLDSIEQLQQGDFFRIYAVTTLKDGTVIDGLDTLYNAYGDAIPSMPGSSVDVIYTVVCPYDQAMAIGSYHAYSSPSEWNAEGDITITADPVDPYTVYVVGLATIEGQVEDGDPIPMHIDPVTYEVTADPTIIATDYWGYTNGKFGGTGEFSSCDGTFTMKFNISVDEGDFGPYTFILTRN